VKSQSAFNRPDFLRSYGTGDTRCATPRGRLGVGRGYRGAEMSDTSHELPLYSIVFTSGFLILVALGGLLLLGNQRHDEFILPLLTVVEVTALLLLLLLLLTLISASLVISNLFRLGRILSRSVVQHLLLRL
jgi:hypothetical protein